MTQRTLALLLLCALACGDDDGDSNPVADAGPRPDMVTADAEIPLDAPATTDDGGPTASCSGEPGVVDAIDASGFLVLSTDYSSTAIGVVGPEADEASLARWVDSSTADPGLVAALSGDVVLPSTMPFGSVALVDRGNDAVTRFCLDGALVGQVRVGTEEVYANPQDAWFSQSSPNAWVSRYEPHADAAEPDRGSDLLAFDADTMTRGSARIDLSAFGGTVTGQTSDGTPADVAVAARPASIAPVREGYLLVGLERLPVDFFGDARGHLPGAVALVDVSAATASLHLLDGLANCGSVAVVPDEGGTAIVACGGYSDAFFGDTATERMTAGLARVTVSEAGSVATDRIWRVTDGPSGLAAVANIVPLDRDRVVGVAWGTFGESGDSLVLTDMGEGSQTVIGSSSDAFALGSGALGFGHLLVPDASAGEEAVWRFTVTADGVTRDGQLPVDPVLPPRQVVRYGS